VSPATWVLACGLIAVGVAVWYFLQPPSADALHRRITEQFDGTRKGLLSAGADIQEFLVRFPQDARAAALREDQKEIELSRLEQTFERQATGFAPAENLLPVERAYLEAINYLRLDPERGMGKLQALVELYGQHPDASGPTGQCVTLARRRLAQLHRELDSMAADLQATAAEQWEEAEQLGRSDPKRARAMYQAIIELYGDKPWAREAVERARAALDEQTPQ
jgi:hypothetical protein